MQVPALKLVDLQRQYSRLKPEIDSAIHEVLNSSVFLKGNVGKQFEQELAAYLNVNDVIGCANGTDALTLALMALELAPGDEVIVPDFTFIASAEAIAFLGLKPVFVPCNPHTFLLDYDSVEKAITHATKAIIPVHLFGQCADMENLMKLAQKNDLYVIEDNAQSLGSEYTFSDGKKSKAGTIGHIGTTSFFPSKNLGCYGDGGAVFTNNEQLAQRIRSIANHGMSQKYKHELIGMNSRLDEIQAAVLRVKLKHLNIFNAERNAVADYYDKALQEISNISTPVRTENSTHVFHQYTIKLKNRDALKAFLHEKGIPSMVYYPIPLHAQEAFKNLNCNQVTETHQLCNEVLSLPMHPELTHEELEYITANIKNYFTQ